MAISLRCTHCQRSLSAGDHLAGKRVKCPGCGSVLLVPEVLAFDDPESIPIAAAADLANLAQQGDEASRPNARAQRPHSPAQRAVPAPHPGAQGLSNRALAALLAIGACLLLSLGVGVGVMLSRNGQEQAEPGALAASPAPEAALPPPTVSEPVVAGDEPTTTSPAPASSDLAGRTPPPNARAANAPRVAAEASVRREPRQGPDQPTDPSSLAAAAESPAPAEPVRAAPEPTEATTGPTEATAPAEAATALAEPAEIASLAAPAPSDDTVRFVPLPLDEPASTMTMSEDGKYLFLAHEGSGTVTVWDIVQERATAAISTDAPRALLCRGNMLYVGNHGEGTISLFDATKDWQLARMVNVDHPGIIYLSAPAGRHFSSTLLVTCHGEGRQASYRDSHIYLVDTRRGRAEAIRKDAVAICSHDGKFVITQQSFNLSPSGGISAYPFSAYPLPKSEPVMRGGIMQTPFVYQVREGTWWICTNKLFAAPQFNAVREDVGRVIVPDLSRNVIYALGENSVTAHQLNVALTELDSRRVTLPPEPSQDLSRIERFLYRHRDYRLDHPLAWTTGEQVDMFVMDLESGEVLHARTQGFAVSPSEEAPQPSRVAGAGVPSGRPAGGTPRDGTPDFMAGFPEFVIEGQPLEHRLPNPEGRLQFALITGPEGMTVSEEGRLQWRPSAEEIGRHRLRIRVVDGSEPFMEEPEVQVVPRSLAEAVGGNLARLRPQVMELDLDPPLLCPSRDGRSLLLVQGDSLRVLGADGVTVEATHQLPNRYQHFDFRGGEYVGVIEGTHTLEILDKASLRTKKRIDLASLGHRVLEVTDLAVHPRRDISYVGIKHDVDVPRYFVLAVNEVTGKAEGEPLLGTWVAVDSFGSELITGYRDLYRSGSRFHINPNWNLLVTPEYGNIDMLIRYEIGGDQPKMRQIVDEAGGNGSGIRLSPDGRRVTYLSFVGFPKHSKNLPGFDTSDLGQPPVPYSAPDGETPKDLAFHPTHPIVAIPTGNSVALLDRETGTELKNRLHLLEGALGEVEIQRLLFSPDGNSLLLLAPGGPTGRQLLKVNLDLSGLKPTPPAPARPDALGEGEDQPPRRNGPRGRGLGV